MAKEKLCPKCGDDITDSHVEADPSVGIMDAMWYCDACDHPVLDEEDDFDDEPPYHS